MANKMRGEVKVTLRGKEYVLRPDFQAIAEIEDQLEAGLPYVFIKAQKGKIGFKEYAAIIYGCILSSGSSDFKSMGEVGEAIRKEGLIKFTDAIRQLLFEMISSENAEEVKKNDVAEEVKSTG